MPLLARRLALLPLLLSATVASAGPVDPGLFGELKWRSIGPYRGGRVLAVTGVANEPEHFYFGAVNGGVWETRDAGRTWAPIFDSAPVGSVGALAVAPSDPKVLYVGTGEADMRSNIAQGNGVYRSADGGRTWHHAGLDDSQQIGRVLVDPANPDVVLVGALGHPYGPNETRGVYRTENGGRTWQRTLFLDADTGATDLAFESGNAQVVYAALWQTRRPPWNVYPPSSGAHGGLYKSNDGGRTWSALSHNGLPATPGRIGLAVSPSEPRRVYALVDATEGGLYRSDDAGTSWRRVADDPRIWKRGWYFGGVSVDPKNPDVVYICNTAMYRSVDGGTTFLPVKGAPGGDDYHQLWIDPSDPQRQILGVDQGAVVTVDGGASWSSWFNQPTGQFYHVVTDDRFPYWVYGSQQDSGAAGIPSRTESIDGISLTQFREMTAGGESDNVAPDPDNPDLLFGGRVDRYNVRTGQTRNIDPTLAYPGLYRGEWTLPLVFSKAGPRALYFGNQRIFRTTDRGAHWEAISPDLSREHPAIPTTLDAATIADDDHGDARRGIVYAIGPSPRDSRLLWAGTDDGLVWKTLDGGLHWQDVTPKGLESWSKIGVVEPSHFDPRVAYVAVDRHRVDDPRPYVYRTRDGGASWMQVADGLADGGPVQSVNVVREDPVRAGLLYAGTEHGVFVSFDDGDHWQALQANLPRTSIRDIDVHGADLVIATHGRGFWIMDDVTALRAVASDARAAPRLYAPAAAIRTRPSGFTGSPMPLDEPRGANPPAGAAIDYVLGTTPAEVTLTITNAAGKIVRRYSSVDPAVHADLAKIAIAPVWLADPAVLSNSPGAHRFVWDLRYAVPSVLASGDPGEEEKGIAVPPGRYWVELAAGEHHERQPLEVILDPRVKLPSGAASRQAAASRRIETLRVAIATPLAEASRLQASLSALDAGDSKVATAASAAKARLAELADLAPPLRTPDSTGADTRRIQGLRHLAAGLQALARASESADADPGTDLLRGIAEYDRLATQALGDWTTFKGLELARLNAALAESHRAPLVP